MEMGQSPRPSKRSKKGSNNGADINSAFAEEIPALRIPEILDHILKYCDVETLKTCRLVSKSWQNSSITPLRAYSTVKLYGAARSAPPKETKSLSNFLKFLHPVTSESSLSLYSNFELRIPSAILECDNLATFWGLCGRNVKTLKLSNCLFHNIDLFRSWIFKVCPNLEELNLNSLHVNGNKRREPTLQEMSQFHVNRTLKSLTINCNIPIRMAISWMELLGHFPALEVLKLTNGPRKEIVSDAFAAINRIRQANPKMLKLRHIRARISSSEAGEQIPDSFAKFLIDPNIHLESLSLNINSNDDGLTLKQILSAQGSTLNTLILGRDKDLTFLDPMKVFPLCIKDQTGQEEKLIKLNELKLQSRVFTGLEFLKFMPNLRKLFINDPITHQAAGIIPETNLCNMKNVKLGRCLELELVNSIYSQDLTHLASWMPNIERLKMPLNNKTFPLVCKNWQNMTSLWITCSRVTEFGFTGLDSKYVAMLKGNINNVDMTRSISTARTANITWLKHLRTLCMEDNSMQSRSSLGHLAGTYGIRQLPCLNLFKLKRIWFDPTILSESFRESRRGNEVEYRNVFT